MTSALVLDLDKKFTLSLEKAGITNLPKLEVRLALDHSGSMSDEYACGLVDRFVNRFIPAAMKFDDNQSLDVGFFHTGWVEAPSALIEDAGNYLSRKKPNVQWGGTTYTQIIEANETRLQETSAPKSGGIFGMFKKAPTGGNTSPFRGYCAIITDGDNERSDKPRFEAAMDRTSGDTFFEFILIGNDIRPDYLKSVAARYPHTNFSHIVEPKKITDEAFYEFLCNPKFVKWANG